MNCMVAFKTISVQILVMCREKGSGRGQDWLLFLSGNNPGVAAYQKLLFALRCYKDTMYVVCLLFKAGNVFVVICH